VVGKHHFRHVVAYGQDAILSFLSQNWMV